MLARAHDIEHVFAFDSDFRTLELEDTSDPLPTRE